MMIRIVARLFQGLSENSARHLPWLYRSKNCLRSLHPYYNLRASWKRFSSAFTVENNDVNRLMELHNRQYSQDIEDISKGSEDLYAHNLKDEETLNIDCCSDTRSAEENALAIYSYYNYGKSYDAYENLMSSTEDILNMGLEELLKYEACCISNETTKSARLFWFGIFINVQRALFKTENTDEVNRLIGKLQEIVGHLETRDGMERWNMLLAYSTSIDMIGSYYYIMDLPCPPHHQQVIGSYYKKVQHFPEMFTSFILHQLMRGLVSTDFWMTFFELLPDYYVTGVYKTKILVIVLKRVIEERKALNVHSLMKAIGDFSMGDLVHPSDHTYSTLDDKHYRAYLQACTNSKVSIPQGHINDIISDFSVKTLLWFIGKYSWDITEGTADDLKNYFERHLYENWTGKKGHIEKEDGHIKRNHSLNCSICGKELPKEDFVKEDANQLLRFIESLIKNDTRFTHEQTEKVRRVVQHSGPYDVVVDGCNVYHILLRTCGTWGVNKEIENMITDLKQRYNMRCLIIKRNGFFLSKKIYEMAKVMSLGSYVPDDIYAAYTALLMGPQTFYLSNDIKKNNMSSFDYGLGQILFQKWQWNRQIRFRLNYNLTSKRCTPTLWWPTGTTRKPIIDERHWRIHVPFHVKKTDKRRPYRYPTEVLCLSRLDVDK